MIFTHVIRFNPHPWPSRGSSSPPQSKKPSNRSRVRRPRLYRHFHRLPLPPVLVRSIQPYFDKSKLEGWRP